MAREDTPLDQEVFDRVLKEQLDAGTDKRVAEGRARSAAPCAPTRPRTPRRRPRRRRRRRHRGGDGAAAGCAAPAAAAPAQAAMVAAPASAPTRHAPLPTGNIPTPKKGAPDKHRLLALVPPEGIQRVEREQGDRVNVWPHLLIEEFVAMFVLSVGLVVFSTFLNALLRSSPTRTSPEPVEGPVVLPRPPGAPALLPPDGRRISIPTFILVGLAAVPFVDRNPSVRPGDRKVALTLFTMMFMFGAVLTIIGSFFRGPGYNWTWPWAQGVLRAVTFLAALSAGLIAAIAALIAVVDLRDRVRRVAALLPAAAGRRRRHPARAAGLPAPPSRRGRRRDFFRKSSIASLLVFGAQFGGASIAFLWPNLKGGFGA